MEAQKQYRSAPIWQAMIQRYGPSRGGMWQWIRVAPEEFRDQLIVHAKTVLALRKRREASHPHPPDRPGP